MERLAEVIAARQVPENSLAIYWLCQAGFAFKSSANQVVYVDPYLSDVVEREIGFKRMMTCPITVKEVKADLIVCTHEHLDHMDTDALQVLSSTSSVHFTGPIECMKEFERQGIPSERCHLLEEGKSLSFGDLVVHAVYADHGELAPDALGVVLDFARIRVYHTGDTAFRPKEFQPALSLRPDILLPCINGAFGNLDAEEAALLTQMVAPAVVIPTHFWMFVEQNGDPRRFLQRCKELAPATTALLLKPGEEFLFGKRNA